MYTSAQGAMVFLSCTSKGTTGSHTRNTREPHDLAHSYDQIPSSSYCLKADLTEMNTLDN